MEFIDHILDNVWLHLIIISSISDIIRIWQLFNEYIYLQIILLTSIFYFIAKIISATITGTISSLSNYFSFKFGHKLAKLLKSPAFYLSFLIGLIFTTFSVEITESTQTIVLSIIKSAIIVISALSTSKIMGELLQYKAENASAKDFIQMAMLPLLKNSFLIFMIIIAIHQVFAVWGIDMAAILAAAGIAGLAIGMAAKDMLSDVIAGILIMTDQPYSAGQTIELNSGTRGMIMEIGLRSTRILTKDNIELIIPNNNMGNTEIINESSSKKEGIRLKLLISTAAGVDVDYIRSMLIEILDQQESLMPENANKVLLVDFNDNVTTFCLVFWVSDPGLRGSVPAQIREDVYKKFLAENVPLGKPVESEIIIKALPNLFGQGEPRKIR